MTSLRAAAGERPVDSIRLLDAFTSRLETRIEALFGGRFDATDWEERQITTGRQVEIIGAQTARPRTSRPAASIR